jgi:hypothetical protein
MKNAKWTMQNEKVGEEEPPRTPRKQRAEEERRMKNAK